MPMQRLVARNWPERRGFRLPCLLSKTKDQAHLPWVLRLAWHHPTLPLSRYPRSLRALQLCAEKGAAALMKRCGTAAATAPPQSDQKLDANAPALGELALAPNCHGSNVEGEYTDEDEEALSVDKKSSPRRFCTALSSCRRSTDRSERRAIGDVSRLRLCTALSSCRLSAETCAPTDADDI